MGGDRIAGPALDPAERLLEPVVLEGFDLAAAVADHVVVMMAALLCRLVSGRPVPELNPLDEAVPAQLVERPVDACEAHALAGGAEPVEDLLRSEAAGLAREELDDRAPRAAALAARKRLALPAPLHTDIVPESESDSQSRVESARWLGSLSPSHR